MSPKGGFYAEYAVVKANNAAMIPQALSTRDAGVLAVDGVTALDGLDKTLRLKAGESILILGASGGIGHLAVQLAKRMKARVLAVASGQGGFRRPERCVRRRKAWQLPRPLKQRRTSGGTIRCTDWCPGPN